MRNMQKIGTKTYECYYAAVNSVDSDWNWDNGACVSINKLPIIAGFCNVLTFPANLVGLRFRYHIYICKVQIILIDLTKYVYAFNYYKFMGRFVDF